MNRISPLLQKLSELYLSKVRTQYLQEELREGDIDTVMRQTRSAYSELLEWQRTMAEIESLLLNDQPNGSHDSFQLPEPPQQQAPVRTSRPAAMPRPAAEPVKKMAPPPPPPAPEPEPEPEYNYADDGYIPQSMADMNLEEDEQVEEMAPPPPLPPPKQVQRQQPQPIATIAPTEKQTASLPAGVAGHVSDIRELVTVNDKYLFVSELFNHNRTAYEKAMEAINKFRSRIQATNWVNALVKKEYKWDEESATAKTFYKVINQYFASR
jgi:hypothetical protein